MSKDLRIAIVGLDTSHAVQFPRLMQAPDCSADQRIEGMRTVTCLRFATPFQTEEDLDERQKQLESWGIAVTTDFKTAVSGVDAIMLEINDPVCHLEYFQKCAELKLPLFLDKPLADTAQAGRKICAIAAEKDVRVFSCSSLRFVPQVLDACNVMPAALLGHVYGPLGVAAAGSSIVWYGVHAFEMLEYCLGTGAVEVTTREDANGVVCIVDYCDRRRGIVELTEGGYVYGGCLRTLKQAKPFVVDMGHAYSDLLAKVRDFFAGADAPVSLDQTLHIMEMLDAAERSRQSGKPEAL